MKNRFATICLLLAGWLPLFTELGNAAEIRLRPEFVCRRAVVTVGDIVEMRNLRREEAEELGAIELFTAPPAQQERLVRVAEVRELLSLHGVDLAAVQFQGAEQVRIRSTVSPRNKLAIRDETPVVAEQSRAVFYVKRLIARGETVRASDIVSKALTTRDPRQDYVLNSEEIVGHEALRPLDPGQPVLTSALRKPLLVFRNETVSTVSRSAGVQVRTSAKALENGAAGDVITIEMPDKSKSKLSARVVGPKIVEIYAAAPVVTASR